ncbi:MAG: SPOR domain-containing protein [Methylophilales bacterium]|nr:SPOR domain-containing protein [Methylophilales bacterium]
MAKVVIEDQSPIMHRAKIRLGIASALLAIALVSLLLAGTSNKPRPVAPLPKTTAPAMVVTAQQKAPVVTAKVEVEKLEESPPTSYEVFPNLQSFTADPAAVAEITDSENLTPKPRKELDQGSIKPIETTDTGDFILQVGVFGDPGNAEKQRDSLAKHGIESRLESKCRIGPFSDAAELEAAKEKLQSSGISGIFTEESSSRGLLLRVGFDHDLTSLKQLRSSLEAAGFNSRSETRVLVGPFDNKKTADAARNRIKALNMAVALMPNR